MQGWASAHPCRTKGVRNSSSVPPYLQPGGSIGERYCRAVDSSSHSPQDGSSLKTVKKLVLRILILPSAFLVVAAIPFVLMAGLSGALWVLVASYWMAALLAWHMFEDEVRAGFLKRR